jgi:hypothetical protein
MLSAFSRKITSDHVRESPLSLLISSIFKDLRSSQISAIVAPAFKLSYAGQESFLNESFNSERNKKKKCLPSSRWSHERVTSLGNIVSPKTTESTQSGITSFGRDFSSRLPRHRGGRGEAALICKSRNRINCALSQRIDFIERLIKLRYPRAYSVT